MKYKIQYIKNHLVIFKIALVLFVVVLFSSCSSIKLNQLKKHVKSELQSPRFANHITGFLIVDNNSKDPILSKNSTTYFIPASTAKLFTLFTANRLLNENIPTLKYVEHKDSVYIQGTGDPSWFHPYFKDSTALSFIRKLRKPVSLHLKNFIDAKYRPGWAWEDYQYDYSPELSAIPMYGNVVTIYKLDSLRVSPTIFSTSTKETESKTLRNLYNNMFYVPKKIRDTLTIPYLTSDELTQKFLGEKLEKKVVLSKDKIQKPYKILFGIKTDSVYKRMLSESDNFLAEQLMLVSASKLSDTLSFDKVKEYVIQNYLNDLKQQPRWVDGSGLSRYNLFTPESMVVLLQKLYDSMGEERLFNLLPTWNSSGTVPGTKSLDQSFIFAKSGSMGNTYNLCGYLKTKSGKLLVFSYMNNHFRIPTKEIKLQIEKTLTLLHDAY